jgi:catechol 2,3-dioxygenase-like lactoylglutathione lyase family enzyme
MAIRYKALGHVALFCNNYEVMYDFYVNKLHFEEKFHLNKEDGSLWLTYVHVGSGQYLELFPESYPGENRLLARSHAHFCFEVGNFRSALEEIQAAGITVYDGPEGAELKGSFDRKAPGMCGSLCAFIKDPEGNWIEIMQFTPMSMQILCV